MRNFKLTIEYDGTLFNGWQRQGQGERTVQGELETLLAKIFKVESVSVIASGRTDSGVHAQGQVAHVKAETRMKPSELHKALTAWSPKDIAIVKVQEVDLDFHAQYSVKSKTYRYTILNRPYPSALLRHQVLFFPYKLNITAMRRAAKLFIGLHDFKSFQAYDKLRADKTTVRTIKKLTVTQQDDLILIDITADGFLYKMVRNITGLLLEVGRGQRHSEEVLKLLKAKDRTQSAKTAPAEGLSLLKVLY